MGKHDNGHSYPRQDRDFYPTPKHVTQSLLPFVPPSVKHVWEPAAGDGAISNLFAGAGYKVTATDITSGADYLTGPPITCDAIITNPPYGPRGKLIDQFIERSLVHMRADHVAWIAMLLPHPHDCAKTRAHLFGSCREYAMKVTLTERITWFEPAVAQPKDNHAWFIWDKSNTEAPNVRYVYGREAP